MGKTSVSNKRPHGFFRLNVDRNLIIILIVFYTVYEIIAISKTLLLSELNSSNGSVFLEVFIADWIVVIGFMIVVAHITSHLMELRKNWFWLLAIHFVFSLLIGVCIILVSYLVLKFQGKIPENLDNINQILIRILSVSDDNFLVYFSMLSIIYSYTYFKNLGKYRSQQSELKSQLLETKMAMLKSQLDPHFIFNTLNSISSLVEIDKSQAQKTISYLSELLRDIIKSKSSNLITLKQELSILDKYINLLVTRFSEDIVIETKIGPHLGNKMVPNLIIQSLIENSIKHGFSYKIKKLKIVLSVFQDLEGLNIVVENDGKYLEGTFMYLLSKGSGLKNIIERLETIYGSNNYQFSIENRTLEQGVRTKITIPIKHTKAFHKKGRLIDKSAK